MLNNLKIQTLYRKMRVTPFSEIHVVKIVPKKCHSDDPVLDIPVKRQNRFSSIPCIGLCNKITSPILGSIFVNMHQSGHIL